MIASLLVRPRRFHCTGGRLVLDAVMARGRAPGQMVTAALTGAPARYLEIELVDGRRGRYRSGDPTPVAIAPLIQLNGHWMRETHRWIFAARDYVRCHHPNDFEPAPGNALTGHEWDCLATLGLETLPTAADHLKSAWRRRLREVHPDLGGCPEETMRVIDAYEALRRWFEAAA